VGLRWWNNVKDDGSNEWVFESLEDMSQIGYMDSRIFWWSLYLTPAVWGVFCFVSLLKFDLSWCVMCSIAITLSSANIYGYTKCRCVSHMCGSHSIYCVFYCNSKEAKAKLSQAGALAGLATGMSSGPLGFLGNNVGASALTSMLGGIMNLGKTGNTPRPQDENV
jgi:hypothetical protein